MKNDECVKGNEKLPNGEFVVQLAPEAGVDRIEDVEKCIPSHFGAFTLSQKKWILNNIVKAIDGFYSCSVY